MTGVIEFCCAALQGVPVPLGVSKSAAYTLIGNAVPPRLAQAISEQVFIPLLGGRA
ncbi:DNA cytosine methyltransferase [Deinococcus sp.]|uniref:DNA cytosine methyltransferase n=1 Tax=Deinococcus sp. TaxID=47478 RepID=UPI0025F89D05|nr:DNA cytosine methyltransferase [Deinococcus sp.]